MDRSASRAALGLSEDSRVGLFFASVQLVKNFSVMLQLIEILPQIKWLLALRGGVPGDSAGNANVRIFQDPSHEQLARLYAAAEFSVGGRNTRLLAWWLRKHSPAARWSLCRPVALAACSWGKPRSNGC
jgi:hypothetical protein